jgi:predicted ATPase
MLTRIEIDNFKTFNQFSIDLTEMNVFIGFNSVGKSSILHAINLLSSFGTGDLENFLMSRNWEGIELRSKLRRIEERRRITKRNIKFTSFFTFGEGDEALELKWSFTLRPLKNKMPECIRESIIDVTKDHILLNRDSKSTYWHDFTKDQKEIFPAFNLNDSMLTLIDLDSVVYQERFPQLYKLKKFIKGIQSLELLSPEKMKKSSKKSTDVGVGGERLSAFLHSLTPEQKGSIEKHIREYYPSLRSLVTTKKRFGHITLEMNEEFEETIAIKANYISDGLLRIIAISALNALSDEYTSLLFDEIEDGINPDLAAQLIHSISSFSQNYHKQIFVTTHSPIMVNYFNEENIYFLWRDPNHGYTKSVKPFLIDEIKEKLEYMHPGELWLNMEQDKLLEILEKEYSKNQDDEEE